MNVMEEIRAEQKSEGDDLWFKDAIIYQLHVKAFADSNHDGIGDFAGLTQRLDYLQDLGVNTLWLLPFYPSPGRDDGYDISDYRRINPDFGTMQDFRRFMREAKRRKLRVITELVINHTSDQHPWFQRARRSRRVSDARNWYVWSDTDHRYPDTRIIFNDAEKSNWAWDPVAEAYYWHRFFSHQPDLNFDNPRVLLAIVQVMRWWLDLGVDGFRLDAIPYLCEREGTNNENLPETHAIIKQIRAALDAYAPGKVLLAEANQWPEDVSAYFGDGDECHMAYHFPLMPRIYMAIAQEDRFPIADILRQTPEIPPNCQWALFLRNHDELTLEMVTDMERDYLWSTYATDPRARINLGIRRRLASLMDNDRRKIELMNSLLFSFPGTPIIYYGDEIGMGDNIYLGDRNGVRTPMQWTPDRNGGFSRCDPARLYHPMIMDPVYGYESVNVEAQSRSLASLLSWTKRLISVRKSTRVLGRGSLAFIRPTNRAVLVYVRQYENEVLLCIANMSRSAQAAEIDLSPWRGRTPLELLGRKSFPPIGDQPYVVTLAPYGFFWFQLCDSTGAPIEAPSIVPEFETLVLAGNWTSLAQGHARHTLERDVLPAFLAGRRWFAERASRSITAKVATAIPLVTADPGLTLAVIETTAKGGTAQYLLPLTIKWNRLDRDRRDPQALAAVRRGPREGTLHRRDRPNRIHLPDTRKDAGWRNPRWTGWTTIGVQAQCRIFVRRQRGGPRRPRGRHRAVEHDGAGRQRLCGQAVSPAGARRQSGDRGWPVPDRHGCVCEYAAALGHRGAGRRRGTQRGLRRPPLRRKSRRRLVGDERLSRPLRRGAAPAHGRAVGRQRRAGGLSAVDAANRPAGCRIAARPLQPGRHCGFRARADHPEGRARLVRRGLAARRAGARRIGPRRNEVREADRATVDALLAYREALPARLSELLPDTVEAMKIRHHGDFHLGQMLIVKDDVVIIDFEGEPRRSIKERRRKAPAARDVAGLIRSIDYSATAALDRALQSAPDEHGKIARALDNWRERSVATVVAAYRESLADPRLWPRDPQDADRLLDFFLLEKALYEIEYELAHRPDWLHVPVLGTWRILSRSEALAT